MAVNLIRKMSHFVFKPLIMWMMIFSFGLKSMALDQCYDLFNEASEEFKNQENLRDNSFNISRRLLTYNILLAAKEKLRSFTEIVKSLSPGSIWADMGAGQAAALKDGLEINKNFLGVAISYKKPKLFQVEEKHRGRLKYLDGDFVENLYFRGKLRRLINKVSLLSDIVGPLSYSKNIQMLFDIYFKILKKDGFFYFTIITERNYQTSKDQAGRSRRKMLDAPVAMNSFEFVDANGLKSPVTMIDWLRTIKGIEIEEITEYIINKNNSDNEPIYEKYQGFRIKKVSSDVAFTADLKPIFYNAGDPPVRSYEISPN